MKNEKFGRREYKKTRIQDDCSVALKLKMKNSQDYKLYYF